MLKSVFLTNPSITFWIFWFFALSKKSPTIASVILFIPPATSPTDLNVFSTSSKLKGCSAPKSLGNLIGISITSPTNCSFSKGSLLIAMYPFTYGGAADLWNTTWSAADVNHADFGLDFSFLADGNNAVGAIDFIKIRIHYTPGAAPSTTVLPLLRET